MRCLSCKYDLRKLIPSGGGAGNGGEHRCPECGRGFDPKDSSTYSCSRWLDVQALWGLWLVLALLAFLAITLGWAFLMIMRDAAAR